MKMKYKILAIFLFAFVGMATAASITDLNVNSPVPLDQKIRVTGTYTSTGDVNGVWCKFLVLDGNTPIDRFSDELTFTDGTFYAERTASEPPFFRDSAYTLRVTCGTASADNYLFIKNKLSPENFLYGELFFLQGNAEFFGVFLIVVVFIIAAVWYILKPLR